MAMQGPLEPATNEQLYADSVAIALALKKLFGQCSNLVEREYFIGIPQHPSPPVQGFEDANNLTTEDVKAMLSVAIDFRNFIDLAKQQTLAQVLRNEPA